jgi:hypothetical protein
MLELIEAVSAPGNAARTNEDAWKHAGAMAAVFDGATGLGENLLPGDSDAAWLARVAAERLAAHAELGLSALEALRGAAGDAEGAFGRRAPIENWEVPFASLMLVEGGGDEPLEAFWFGDCAGLVLAPGEGVQVIGEAFGKRVAEASQATRLAAELGRGPAAAKVDPAFLPALRVSRSRYNTEGGQWVFGPMRACVDHIKRGSVRAPTGSLVLLASDGFLALGTDYGRYDAAALVEAARDRGLAAMLTELRAIEADDPDGTRFPRFKTSDDATAMLLRVV